VASSRQLPRTSTRYPPEFQGRTGSRKATGQPAGGVLKLAPCLMPCLAVQLVDRFSTIVRTQLQENPVLEFPQDRMAQMELSLDLSAKQSSRKALQDFPFTRRQRTVRVRLLRGSSLNVLRPRHCRKRRLPHRFAPHAAFLPNRRPDSNWTLQAISRLPVRPGEFEVDLFRTGGRTHVPIPGLIHHPAHLGEPPPSPCEPSLTVPPRAGNPRLGEVDFHLLCLHSQSFRRILRSPPGQRLSNPGLSFPP